MCIPAWPRSTYCSKAYWVNDSNGRVACTHAFKKLCHRRWCGYGDSSDAGLIYLNSKVWCTKSSTEGEVYLQIPWKSISPSVSHRPQLLHNNFPDFAALKCFNVVRISIYTLEVSLRIVGLVWCATNLAPILALCRALKSTSRTSVTSMSCFCTCLGDWLQMLSALRR